MKKTLKGSKKLLWRGSSKAQESIHLPPIKISLFYSQEITLLAHSLKQVIHLSTLWELALYAWRSEKNDIIYLITCSKHTLQSLWVSLFLIVNLQQSVYFYKKKNLELCILAKVPHCTSAVRAGKKSSRSVCSHEPAVKMLIYFWKRRAIWANSANVGTI